MKNLSLIDREIYDLIDLELNRQSSTLEMIASENFTSSFFSKALFQNMHTNKKTRS